MMTWLKEFTKTGENENVMSEQILAWAKRVEVQKTHQPY